MTEYFWVGELEVLMSIWHLHYSHEHNAKTQQKILSDNSNQLANKSTIAINYKMTHMKMIFEQQIIKK